MNKTEFAKCFNVWFAKECGDQDSVGKTGTLRNSFMIRDNKVNRCFHYTKAEAEITDQEM